MSKKIAIVSGKGGTGKSMFAANIALSLAYRGSRVLLIDMSIGLRTLDLYLGVQDQAIYDICDVTSGRCRPDRAIIVYDRSSNLSFIPACQNPEEVIDEIDLRLLFQKLESDYDYIIMDCPPGSGGVIDACTACCDAATIVLTSDYSAVRDADATEDRLIRSGVMNRNYVINRMMPGLIKSGIEPDLETIDTRLKCQIVGMIAEDESVRASTSAGVPAASIRESYFAGNFDRMAARLVEYLDNII